LAVTSLLKDFLDPSTKDFGRDEPAQGFFDPSTKDFGRDEPAQGLFRPFHQRFWP
jgi:hypothetical protein